jgi:hypothetical protein
MPLRAVRRIVVSLAALLMVPLIAVVTIRTQRSILRHRAETLLADVQSVNLRHTTFRDVQPMFNRWRRWGKYEGSCTQERCTFDIWLSRLGGPLNEFLYRHNRIFDFAGYLGERPTAIHARLVVLDGFVWADVIAFGIETRRWSTDGKPYLEIVGGEATSVSKAPFLRGSDWRMHPDYAIWWPTNLQNEIRLEFTPFANPVEIHRLMVLNFVCLTRKVPCRDKRDFMPAAMAQVDYWSSLPSDPRATELECQDPDPLLLELSARDAQNIVIAKVGVKRPHAGPGGLHERALIVKQVLKTSDSLKTQVPSNFWMFEFPGSNVDAPSGSLVIVFLRDDNFDGYSLDGCSPLATTAAHLSSVRRGIAEDTRPSGLPSYAGAVSSR